MVSAPPLIWRLNPLPPLLERVQTPNDRGWYAYEIWWMYICWWLFVFLEYAWFRPLQFVSRGHTGWAHESHLWLCLAGGCWLLTEAKRGDLPPVRGREVAMGEELAWRARS